MIFWFSITTNEVSSQCHLGPTDSGNIHVLIFHSTTTTLRSQGDDLGWSRTWQTRVNWKQPWHHTNLNAKARPKMIRAPLYKAMAFNNSFKIVQDNRNYIQKTSKNKNISLHSLIVRHRHPIDLANPARLMLMCSFVLNGYQQSIYNILKSMYPNHIMSNKRSRKDANTPTWQGRTSIVLYMLSLFTPWKINMEHTNHPFRRKMIFQTSMIMFHVNLPGCRNCAFLCWYFSCRKNYCSSRYMQIWMNLQNQDATLLILMTTFIFGSPSDNKIPGRERNQSTATARVLNLEARMVHTTISVVVIPCMSDFRNSWEASFWLRMVAAASNF